LGHVEAEMMMQALRSGVVLLLLISSGTVSAFRALSVSSQSTTRLGLFGLFGGKKEAPQSAVVAGGKGATSKADYKLEKVSNTQGRDWKAESARIVEDEAKRRRVLDKQPTSYNYKKANEFPNLYLAWLVKGGDQIGKQIVAATKKAISDKKKLIEVCFDPVPNLSEVEVGSDWNQRFRLEIAQSLKVPDFATNRGSASTLEWSTLYWANRLVQGLGSPRALIVSVSGEGTRGQFLPTLAKGATLVRLSDLRTLDPAIKPSVVLVLSPCTESHYAAAKTLSDQFDCPAIALNAPFSYRYDLGGSLAFELAYIMKRVPKGWAFRLYPNKFQGIVEGPDYEILKSGEFASRPSLPELSKSVGALSDSTYGRGRNDRIFENRL
jgi:hypothetical protein